MEEHHRGGLWRQSFSALALDITTIHAGHFQICRHHCNRHRR